MSFGTYKRDDLLPASQPELLQAGLQSVQYALGPFLQATP